MLGLPPSSVGKTLKELRLASGLSQDALVKELRTRGVHITKAALSKYELAKSLPSIPVVHALSAVFEIGPDFLINPQLPSLRWEPAPSPRQSSKRRKERAAAAVLLQCGTALGLRRSLGFEAIDSYVAPIPLQLVRDAEQAATTARARWQIPATKLIPSLVDLIERLGGLVIEDLSADALFDALGGWVDRRIPVVVLNPLLSPQLRRQCIGREIGHLLLDLSSVNPRIRKSVVERFVRAFLLPAPLMRSLCGSPEAVTYQELAQIAAQAGLTFEACLIRAAEIRLIEPLDELRLAQRVRAHSATSAVGDRSEERPKELMRLAERALAQGILTRAQFTRLTSIARDKSVKDAALS